MTWTFLRMRAQRAWAAFLVAWRGDREVPVTAPRKRRRPGVWIAKASRWLNDRLVQLVALALMLALLVLLGKSYRIL